MKTTKEQIDEFLAQPAIAVAGWSTNSRKFGAMAYNALREKGFDVYPVNPAGGTTPEGGQVYKNLAELPRDVKAIYVVTKPDVSLSVINDARSRGFTHFWIQQMSENKQVLEALENAPHKVAGECIILHSNPTGFHKIHWWIARLLGKIPAETKN
jgi:uncharacterized protein